MNTNYYNNASAAARSVFVILFGTLMSVCGDGLDFSLTSGSPKVPSPFNAADDIEALGAYARIPAAALGGFAASSDVNGLSYGQSEAADVTTSPYYYKRLAYSVKHGAAGNGGAPVTTEVNIDGAAGDTFALDFVGYGTQRYILRSPFTLVKAQTRSLTVQNSPPRRTRKMTLTRSLFIATGNIPFMSPSPPEAATTPPPFTSSMPRTALPRSLPVPATWASLRAT